MIKLLSHLSYVAITSPDVEASVRFYEEQVGLTVVDRVDGAVYLRNVPPSLKPGDFAEALIEDADAHDLFGVLK